ncbi:mechanosensitive ion channel family protein [Pelagicoccus sp. SDUM812003]|uniref:mechanosensitive ion channel family protein n=1 Tax=Pelagicoccus sp. SDUM812003 TaxID=3041267 RepID=UPI0028103663|nr:mechanosensitive ion channel family protein [Pelagicoccus sp. SDUM812003]MDQ8202751.1 mechanosensitive ion channel family protein [Pelagicoccus sp. SDUM812003]
MNATLLRVFLALTMFVCPAFFLQAQVPSAEEATPSAEESATAAEASGEQGDSPRASENAAYGFSELRKESLDKLSELTDLDFGGNSGLRLAMFFVLLLATFVIRKIVVAIYVSWFHRVAERTSWSFDDKLIPALTGPIGWMVYVVGFFLSISSLSLSTEVDLVILRIFQASTMTVLFWGLLRVVDVMAEVMVDVARERDMGVYHFIPLIKKTARVFLIVIAVVLVVQNLGYSVGSLLAGMGIGGLALALAAQQSLANFFGSVSIVADRPFKVGDWIQVGSRVDGDVEEIGLRSTKVRTWAKSQLTIPNKVLADEIIENWSRMPKRRVKQTIGVTYSTSPENMEGLVEDIRKLLREDDGVNQDFILVNFTDFGDSALQILVYYFTSTTAWLEHMDIRQRINLKIMKAVQGRGSSIAFPTRTVHLEGVGLQKEES